MAIVQELCLTGVPHVGENAKADYAGQGVWNLKAAAEARKFGDVHMPAGSTANGEGAYPPVEEWCAFLSPWSCCGLSRVCLLLVVLCICCASPSCIVSFEAQLAFCSAMQSRSVSDSATKGQSSSCSRTPKQRHKPMQAKFRVKPCCRIAGVCQMMLHTCTSVAMRPCQA